MICKFIHLSFILSLSLALVTVALGDLVSDLKTKHIELVVSGDKSYPTASAAYNRRFVVHPKVITFPKNAGQVSAVVKLAGQYSNRVAARRGGHSYIANSLGDKMAHGTAIIGAGSRLGNVALTLGETYKRAMPHGTCPYVGIGGLASCGGFGFTSRMWGLTLDVIKSMEVVLANGTIKTIDEKRDKELFWGMRGAAPSLAIATSFRMQTFPIPAKVTVFEYWWDLDAASAAKAFDSYQTFATSSIPLEFGSEIVLSKGGSQGRVELKMFGGYYAANETLGKVVSPFLVKLPPRKKQKFTLGSYLESATYLGGLGRLDTTRIPDGHDTFYVKSLMTPVNDPMNTKARNAFMQYLANEGYKTKLDWFIGVEQFAGERSKINEVPLNAMAFGKRDTLFTFQFYAYTPNHEPPFPSNGFDLVDGMVRSITANQRDGWKIGGYPNYIDNRLTNWQQMYYGPHYERLRRLKGQVDPKNVFKAPLSIEPPSK